MNVNLGKIRGKNVMPSMTDFFLDRPINNLRIQIAKYYGFDKLSAHSFKDFTVYSPKR